MAVDNSPHAAHRPNLKNPRAARAYLRSYSPWQWGPRAAVLERPRAPAPTYGLTPKPPALTISAQSDCWHFRCPQSALTPLAMSG